MLLLPLRWERKGLWRLKLGIWRPSWLRYEFSLFLWGVGLYFQLKIAVYTSVSIEVPGVCVCVHSWKPVWMMLRSSSRMRCWGGLMQRTASRLWRRSWSSRRTSTMRSAILYSDCSVSSKLLFSTFSFINMEDHIHARGHAHTLAHTQIYC